MLNSGALSVSRICAEMLVADLKGGAVRVSEKRGKSQRIGRSQMLFRGLRPIFCG